VLETDPLAHPAPDAMTAGGRVVQVNISPGGVPKQPVGRAAVRRLGLEGDAHAHIGVHGGPHRAVCLFAIEAIRRVAAEGHPIAPGTVGENLTTEGIELALLAPGTRLAIGEDVLLEVSGPANPCDVIRGSFREGKSGRISILKHPMDSRVYARVLAEGSVAVGDDVRVLPPAADSGAVLHQLVERLEACERRFWLATWEAVAASGADLRILDLGDLIVCAAPGLRGGHFNAAYGLRYVPELRSRALEHLRTNTELAWVVDLEPPVPGQEPDMRGSVLGADADRILDAPKVDGLTIREVDADEAAAWEIVVCDGFELKDAVRAVWLAAARNIAAIPGMHLLLAELDGRPAGAAGLFTRARVGDLSHATVLPWARGRGVHGALISARARLAEEHGCTLITAQTDSNSQSERNMMRLGLERLFERGVYRVAAP
jgi:MOSC domain-containing protein YiiM/GNAT superfamily N-acetyltransferase